MQCMDAAANGNLPDCKPYGFTLVDWVTVLAPVGALGTGVVWVFEKARRGRARIKRQVRTWRDLQSAVRPLLIENHRLFRDFGPNSGAQSVGPVRFDLSVWRHTKNTIGENNQRIATLLRAHQELVPRHHRSEIGAWLSHIYAFAAHLRDDAVDYRHHQFPKTIPALFGTK